MVGAALCKRACADFVAGAAHCEDFVAATASCELPGADVLAGAVLCKPVVHSSAQICEPRSTDFIAGAALCKARSADFVEGAAICEPREPKVGTLIPVTGIIYALSRVCFCMGMYGCSIVCAPHMCALTCVLLIPVLSWAFFRGGWSLFGVVLLE